MPLFTLTPAPLLLYAFRYRDELTGKWMKARYRAEHHVITRRFRETGWRIEGPPERRWPLGASFSPWQR
jgi:hypothetical protein